MVGNLDRYLALRTTLPRKLEAEVGESSEKLLLYDLCYDATVSLKELSRY